VGFNAVLGPSVLALAVLKHALLALTYLFMGLAARALLPPRTVWWAAASMVMLPPLGWSSLRDQTHTVLVTAVTAGTWWVLVRLVRRRARRYALLGLMLALGMLSKYNFALFAAALAWRRWACRRCARCCWRAGCGSRRRWRWCWWCRMRCGCRPLARDGARHHRQDGVQPRGGLLGGLGELALTLLETLLPWAAGGLGVSRRLAAAAAGWRAGRGALGLAAAGALPGAGAGGVRRHGGAGGVTEFKEHWMQPLFCVLPLAAFVARPQLESAPGAALHGRGAGGGAAVLSGHRRLPLGGRLARPPGELNQPIRALGSAARGRLRRPRPDRRRRPHAGWRAAHALSAAPAADCDGNLQPVAACVAEQRPARAAGRAGC
jgi:hypothetical protein